MQTENKFIDDISRVAASALGVVSGLRDEAEAAFRARMERVVANMDLVTREEFEAVKAMAARARQENEALSARLAALEATAGGSKPPSAKKTARGGKAGAKTGKATS